jgi:hypothetical protein
MGVEAVLFAVVQASHGQSDTQAKQLEKGAQTLVQFVRNADDEQKSAQFRRDVGQFSCLKMMRDKESEAQFLDADAHCIGQSPD